MPFLQSRVKFKCLKGPCRECNLQASGLPGPSIRTRGVCPLKSTPRETAPPTSQLFLCTWGGGGGLLAAVNRREEARWPARRETRWKAGAKNLPGCSTKLDLSPEFFRILKSQQEPPRNDLVNYLKAIKGSYFSFGARPPRFSLHLTHFLCDLRQVTQPRCASKYYLETMIALYPLIDGK